MLSLISVCVVGAETVVSNPVQHQYGNLSYLMSVLCICMHNSCLLGSVCIVLVPLLYTRIHKIRLPNGHKVVCVGAVVEQVPGSTHSCTHPRVEGNGVHQSFVHGEASQ